MFTNKTKKILTITAFILLIMSTVLLVGCKRNKVTLENIKQSYEKNKTKLDNSKLVINQGILEAVKDFNEEVLYIPDTVNTIKSNAIKNVSSIKLIYISPSVNKISRFAINNVAGLEGIYFDGNKTFEADSICNNVNLKKVVFNNSTVTLAKQEDLFVNPFLSNSNLNDFKIEGDNSNLKFSKGQLLFLNEKDTILLTLTKSFNGEFDKTINYLTKNVDGLNTFSMHSITLPNSIKALYSQSFTGFTNLTSITLPKDATFAPGFITNSPLEEISKEDGDKYFVYENTLVNKDNKTAILLSKKSKLTNSEIQIIGSFATSGNKSISVSEIQAWINETNILCLDSYAFAFTYLKGEINFDTANLSAVGKEIFKGVLLTNLTVNLTKAIGQLDPAYNNR